MNPHDEPCTICERPTPADRVISAPADTGPFTNVEESFDFHPGDRWYMPVCKEHMLEMTEMVGCTSCGRALLRIDGIVNSSGTVVLCRPCNKKENA